MVSRPTRRGEVWEGSPGPHGGGEVCIPACTEADTLPQQRRLLLRAVRILWNAFLFMVKIKRRSICKVHRQRSFRIFVKIFKCLQRYGKES